MCCTIGRVAAKLTGTHLYVGEAEKDGKTVHVMAYQNKAESAGPNAMVLPFPTSAEMSEDNVIDTRKFKHFLQDITNASQRHTKGMSNDGMLRSRRFGAVAGAAAVVFDVGSYTVVLADEVGQIPEALTRVKAARRPTVSDAFLEGYGEFYPDQPIAVCCWQGSIKSEPLLWWYEPKDKSQLFIPTMDAHDGNAPQLHQQVKTDHIISVGTHNRRGGHEVFYHDEIPDTVKSLLPPSVSGAKLPTWMENGDCFVKTADLQPKTLMEDASVILRRGANYSEPMRGWR